MRPFSQTWHALFGVVAPTPLVNHQPVCYKRGGTDWSLVWKRRVTKGHSLRRAPGLRLGGDVRSGSNGPTPQGCVVLLAPFCPGQLGSQAVAAPAARWATPWAGRAQGRSAAWQPSKPLCPFPRDIPSPSRGSTHDHSQTGSGALGGRACYGCASPSTCCQWPVVALAAKWWGNADAVVTGARELYPQSSPGQLRSYHREPGLRGVAPREDKNQDPAPLRDKAGQFGRSRVHAESATGNTGLRGSGSWDHVPPPLP